MQNENTGKVASHHVGIGTDGNVYSIVFMTKQTHISHMYKTEAVTSSTSDSRAHTTC